MNALLNSTIRIHRLISVNRKNGLSSWFIFVSSRTRSRLIIPCFSQENCQFSPMVPDWFYRFIHASSVDIKLFMEISFNYIRKTIQFSLIRLNNFLGDVNWTISLKVIFKTLIEFTFCILQHFQNFFLVFKLPNFSYYSLFLFLPFVCRDIFVT